MTAAGPLIYIIAGEPSGDALGGRCLAEGLVELDVGTDGEGDRGRAEGTGSNLGSRDVDHDRQVRGEGPHAAQPLDARGNVTVGEGETKDVHPGLDQIQKDLIAV